MLYGLFEMCFVVLKPYSNELLRCFEKKFMFWRF